MTRAYRDALRSILHFGAYNSADMHTAESPHIVSGIIMSCDVMADCDLLVLGDRD